MISIVSEIECFRCKKMALEKVTFNTGEREVYCSNCKYSYSQTLPVKKKYNINNKNGYGVACIAKRDGRTQYTMFEERNITRELWRFRTKLEMEDTNPEKSYLIIYRSFLFMVSYGEIPENFLDIYMNLLKTHRPPKVQSQRDRF